MAALALVRRPSPGLSEGITTHIERRPLDVELAGRQWQGYVDALDAAGWSIQEVMPVDECPDGVFVEDALVMFDDLAVATRPGADSRRGEPAGALAAITALGFDTATIDGPGTLDGGDVLKVGRRVYVGRGGRTNPAGVAQLRELLTPRGWQVVAVPLTKALHLKSAVTALPDGTIIGYSPVVDEPAFFPHYRPMPEEQGAHVVDLGQGRLLISSAAPLSAGILADLGYTPVPVDIGEFEKLEGCVTCLSVRVRASAK